MDDFSPDEIEELSKAMGDEDFTEKEEQPEIPSLETEQATMEPLEKDLPSDEKSPGGSEDISHAQFVQLDEALSPDDLPPQSIERMFDVKVKVEVILGSTRKTLEDILKLQAGCVIELNKLAGEPVEILANGKTIAKAEIVVVDDNFGVKIIEIVGSHFWRKSQ
jgi:flagellar motor switch protein FliN